MVFVAIKRRQVETGLELMARDEKTRTLTPFDTNASIFGLKSSKKKNNAQNTEFSVVSSDFNTFVFVIVLEGKVMDRNSA